MCPLEFRNDREIGKERQKNKEPDPSYFWGRGSVGVTLGLCERTPQRAFSGATWRGAARAADRRPPTHMESVGEDTSGGRAGIDRQGGSSRASF